MSARSQVLTNAAGAAPPQLWFGVGAVFHYLGPSFAVLLFPAVGVLGVAWLRIATAAAVFSWTRPWRTLAEATPRTRLLLIGLGLCLAVMNCAFYLALEKLPISLVAAIEFVGTIAVALYGLRTRRNLVALLLVLLGIVLLVEIKWASDPLGLFWALLNGALFVGYLLLGHRVARDGASGGVERLGAAMAIAFLAVLPVGIGQAARAFGDPLLLLAAIGVGISSSVIPYICDQLAMSRLPRASFALLLALLPASATIIGALVLAQFPSLRDVGGILLVMAGVAVEHKPAPVWAAPGSIARRTPPMCLSELSNASGAPALPPIGVRSRGPSPLSRLQTALRRGLRAVLAGRQLLRLDELSQHLRRDIGLGP